MKEENQMQKKVTIATVAALLTAGVIAGGAALASDRHDDEDKAELQALNAAAVTLQQAVATAEAAQGGKAVSAEFDAGEDGGPSVWEIEFISASGEETELHVNAATGDLITGDHDNDHEEDDDRG